LTADSDWGGVKHKIDVAMLQQKQQQQQQQQEQPQGAAPQTPQQLGLPDWSDLSDAESALLAVLKVVGCGFERMRVLREGMQRLQLLPAGGPALHRFRADYRWLQTCLEHRKEAGAMLEFVKGLDQLVDSLPHCGS
jgi:hypothetical protein